MYFKSVFTQEERGASRVYIFYIFESREISWTELLIPRDLEFQYLRGILSLSLFSSGFYCFFFFLFFTAPFYAKAAKKSKFLYIRAHIYVSDARDKSSIRLYI